MNQYEQSVFPQEVIEGIYYYVYGFIGLSLQVKKVNLEMMRIGLWLLSKHRIRTIMEYKKISVM